MQAATSTPRTLSTAEERREAVLQSAFAVFAERGLSAPTTEIAKRAGISQAYLFRLFPTKTELAVAVMDRAHDTIAAAFQAAAAQAKAAGDDPLKAMGDRYQELLQDRHLLLVQLHGHAAAASDPELRVAMRAGFGRLYDIVKAGTGCSDEEIGAFFATGMLLNVLAAMDAFDLDLPWATALCAQPTHDD